MRNSNSIFRKRIIFKILGIVIFVYLILHYEIHNITNHKFSDNHQQTAFENETSLVSPISKNSQIDEKRTGKLEKDYDDEFDYPSYGNISILISQLERGEPTSIAPFKNHEHSYLITNQHKCVSDTFAPILLSNYFPSKWISFLQIKVTDLYLLMIVKSAVQNFEQRRMIRRTWGKEISNFKHFQTKTMFIIGSSIESKIQNEISKENDRYNDLIQVNVIENYNNITIKTLMSLRWAYENCYNAKYFLFVDDDYYVSFKNLLLFLRNPSIYEEYTYQHKYNSLWNRTDLFYEVTKNENTFLEDQNFYAGAIVPIGQRKPHRDNSIQNGKWKISVDEYRYSFYPPFINAGAYVMSQHTMKTMYLATHFVKEFPFDDVYYGIVAKKCGIKLFDSRNFWRIPRILMGPDMKFTIAAHLKGERDQIENIWKQQVKLGHA